ncbi:hypothetical protein CNYM01_06346 [Colletotrichum nymphaeae SA-01]|uniref:Uncharacterized protein n=1 Tax=Colletotrichum nymphaeae SA-01 TaxID=1460502 RepID=A0A135TEM9_9PEZI|nr:hypothetical protein CNYM01_06346 [Colletotrichum nymphaeae SA-01]
MPSSRAINTDEISWDLISLKSRMVYFEDNATEHQQYTHLYILNSDNGSRRVQTIAAALNGAARPLRGDEKTRRHLACFDGYDILASCHLLHEPPVRQTTEKNTASAAKASTRRHFTV